MTNGAKRGGPTVPVIDITLLGRFGVTVDGEPIADGSWTRRHAAALVKVLAIGARPTPSS